jgi:outer membrane protein OmpA-like peptidoglycan-associated protein
MSRLVPTSALWIAAAVAGLAAGPAGAQTVAYKPFDVERLWLEPSGGSSLVASTGDGLEPGGYRLALVGHYEDRPLVIQQAGGAVIGSLVSGRATAHLLAAWSPAAWLDVGFQLPYVISQRGDAIPGLDFPTLIRRGPGTPLVSTRLLLLGQDYEKPVDLSLQLAVALPLGGEQAYSTDGKAAAHPSLGLGRSFGSWRLGGELGMRLRPARGLGSERTGHEVVGAMALTTNGRSLRGELTYRLAVPVVGSRRESAELLGGLRWLAGGWELFGLAGPGFGDAVGTPRFRVLLGVARAPRVNPPGHVSLPPGAAQPPPASPPAWSPTPMPPAPPPHGSLVEAPREAGTGAPAVERAPATPVLPAPPPPPPEPRPLPGKVKIADDRLVLADRVLFESGVAVISEKSYPLLDEVALVLLAHPELGQVAIEGHTDSVGDPRSNLELSQRRAEMVMNYLVVKGLSFSRLRAKGLGATGPVASNATAAGQDRNRRVEFRLLGAKEGGAKK